jgi:hypothetical protein
VANEGTSPFDSLTPLCISGQLTIFLLSLPLDVFPDFRFGLTLPMGLKFFFFFVFVFDSRPINACTYQGDPKKAHSCIKPRRLSHHVCVSDAQSGRYAIATKRQ